MMWIRSSDKVCQYVYLHQISYLFTENKYEIVINADIDTRNTRHRSRVMYDLK